MSGSIHNDPFVNLEAEQSQAANGDGPSPNIVVNDTFVDLTAAQIQVTNGDGPSHQHIRLTTKTNNSGGVQGGISNGAPVYFRVGFKPPATIGQAQQVSQHSQLNELLTNPSPNLHRFIRKPAFISPIIPRCCDHT